MCEFVKANTYSRIDMYVRYLGTFSQAMLYLSLSHTHTHTHMHERVYQAGLICVVHRYQYNNRSEKRIGLICGVHEEILNCIR